MDGITSSANAVEAFAQAGTAVVALLVAIGSAFAGVAWRRKFVLRKKRAGRVARRLSNVVEIHEMLLKIGVHSDCDRATLLVAENGAAVFPTYSTIAYEVCLIPDIPSRKGQWERVRLDASYKAKMSEAVNGDADFSVIRASQLKAGMLKDLYASDGVQMSVVACVTRSHCDDWCVYVSLNYRDPVRLTAERKTGLRLQIAALREEIKRFLPE